MSDASDSQNLSSSGAKSVSSASYVTSSPSSVSLSSDEETRASAEHRTKSMHDVLSRSVPAVIPLSSDDESSGEESPPQMRVILGVLTLQPTCPHLFAKLLGRCAMTICRG